MPLAPFSPPASAACGPVIPRMHAHSPAKPLHACFGRWMLQDVPYATFEGVHSHEEKKACAVQAYYKQYNNLRPKYLENIWKVVNWKDVDARLRDAQA